MTEKEIVQALRGCQFGEPCDRCQVVRDQNCVDVMHKCAADLIERLTDELAVCGGRHMSYDISFKVKVEGVDAYVKVGTCDANITWNARKIIVKSTGLKWKNCQNNGLCVDVIPKIEAGLRKLEQNPDSFKEYEEPNGWGSVKGTAQFFRNILNDWNDFQQWYEELVPVATFWIE